ncbi:hypothetical protein GOODEAATRI_011097 [Goodea atripinnis]|uniref:Uncharacterized protein n=1 Tax=Goodea atripinnis TaxID=208336 RepID=A0ABV0PD35_9TELE
MFRKKKGKYVLHIFGNSLALSEHCALLTGHTVPRRNPPITPPSVSAFIASTPPASMYLQSSVAAVSRGPLALRRADGVGHAAVIFSHCLIALRVRSPRRVALLNGARLLETPAAHQVSHLQHMQLLPSVIVLLSGQDTTSLCSLLPRFRSFSAELLNGIKRGKFHISSYDARFGVGGD